MQKTLETQCKVSYVPLYTIEELPHSIQDEDYDGVLMTCPFSVQQYAKQTKQRKQMVYAMGERTKQALIKDTQFPELCLLPSAQTKDKSAVSPEQMKKLIEDIRSDFDFVLLDCPAGIEQGFQNAIAGAEHAVVVTTPEVSAIRDADRIIGLLEASGIRKTDLLINRLRIDMVKRGDMMSVDDVTEILAVNLLGVIPDDEQVVIATNRGEAVAGEECLAGRSYMDICRRLTGEDVPVNDYSKSEGFFGKIAQFFHRNQEENR